MSFQRAYPIVQHSPSGYHRRMSPTRVLITAGPTHEPIDAVRYIANRSSGRMGIALAEASLQSGWETHLLLGPVTLTPPDGVLCDPFKTTADLQILLSKHFDRCDLLIMAAAVADYRPTQVSESKLKRSAGKLTLELESTPDLVANCVARRHTQRIIAFSLERAEELKLRAQDKLIRKGTDAIVANPLKTMDAETIQATVFTPDGKQHRPEPETLKQDFARWLIAWASEQWQL